MVDNREDNRARHSNDAERGPRPGEITLVELEDLWGFARSWVWTLVTQRRVIPARYDNYRWYVRLDDALAYKHELTRGNPQVGGINELR